MNTRHIVLTKQDGAISLYIDGKLEDLKDGTEISVWTFDPAAIEEFRSRLMEEVVEALEGVPSHIKEPASSDGIFYDEASFNAGYRLAKQKSIETIKKL